ncbi:transmembrane protein 50A isoform X2 [Ptiloglossa arizonensis]|uniref:transmembrane protein 50A isoform X2 n=1 Tax=Ptiloglossa arizonensis TaxID=3350558 RepID=UPI003FA16FBC
MASYFENINPSTCVWFEIGEKRNILASMLAGTLFFVGWWVFIDAHAKYPKEILNEYYLCGILGTISFIMVNSVTNADVRDDAFHGSRVAKSWLFFGFVMGFAGMIAACWILFAGLEHYWPGIGLFLQNLFIFVGSLTYKFGRLEE